MCMCVYVCIYIYYILFVVRVEHHDVRSISDFWSQRFIMIALKCDIILF